MDTPSAPASASPLQSLETSVRELRAQCRRLRILAVAAMLGVIALGIAALGERLANQRLLRTRGIVIEDAAGRDRILIGTPIPASKDRVRTDLARVEKEWGERMGGARYLEAYKSYDNDACGIVLMNEQGFDKVILAEKTPDPNSGKRLIKNSGLTWNDDQGFELGGLGCGRTEDGKYRVILGMDDAQGEAVHMFILEDGTKGLRIAADDMLLLMGRAAKGNEVFGNDQEFAGWMIKDKQGKVVLENNSLKQ